jgi:hypothetical protein
MPRQTNGFVKSDEFLYPSVRIRRLKYAYCITVHSESRYALSNVLEVMSTNVDTGLNPFNFICENFLQISL